MTAKIYDATNTFLRRWKGSLPMGVKLSVYEQQKFLARIADEDIANWPTSLIPVNGLVLVVPSELELKAKTTVLENTEPKK